MVEREEVGTEQHSSTPSCLNQHTLEESLMKKSHVTGIIVVAIAVCFAGSVSATSLNFIGPSYTISDEDGDGFSETLHLDTAFVSRVDPIADGVFGDAAWETVVLTDFFLDPDSFVSGAQYDFAATTYVDGFAVYDDDQTLLFDADIVLSALEVNGSIGEIDPLFSINLINIEAAPDYVVGSSEIIDAFVDYSTGAANFSLQFPNPNIGAMIESGTRFSSTYSGSAAPVPAPEPGTMLLIGSGLLGIAAVARQKRR